MKTRCLLLILLVNVLGYSLADEAQTRKLVKRQLGQRPGERSLPLSRSRQFPPPEELEESEEYVNSEDEEEDRSAVSPFRGRQPQRPPSEEEYSEDYSYTEAPKITSTPKPTARTIVFNNRFAARPRLGGDSSTPTTTTQAPKPSAASTSRSRSRATPAQSQRLDVVANILNKPAPPRSSERSISISSSRTSNLNTDKKPDSSSDTPSSRNTNTSSRPRPRGRFRQRTSTTTTTTTTTTEPPSEEYYYYYEDEEAQKNQPIATTTSTTTTPKPSLPKRLSLGRRPSSGRFQSTPKPVKFDPESQFAPPPEDASDVLSAPSSTKKFTTTSTTTVEPGSPLAAIPAHLRSKYKPRSDGRFIDFLRDPNRPRELKGFDLTEYPFYVRVPEDIDFECEDKKDGYYASVPHHCQLFHYCFAGARYDFLCANYTLYDQTTFTCRFANNVDCLSSEKFYYRNDDLWKETTTTTAAPQTTTPKKRRTTPKEEDYEDYYDYEESDEKDEEKSTRPPKRRRNRNKNRRKPEE